MPDRVSEKKNGLTYKNCGNGPQLEQFLRSDKTSKDIASFGGVWQRCRDLCGTVKEECMKALEKPRVVKIAEKPVAAEEKPVAAETAEEAGKTL